MRIIDLQRRLREVGRIRIGEQVPTGGGRSRPKKLEHFRLTSRDQFVIEAAAEQWGGEAKPWANAPGGEQWEVYTEAKELPVVVPPGDMSFSQAYEQWTAGGCQVRCDGRWDHLADKACHCDPENRACDIHTRLSVMLPNLPGVGVWRLDTQGYYAAVELGGIVDLVSSHAERGIMLPARLRLEQRSVKRIDKGKVVTRNFAVPVLDIDVHPLELGRGQVPAGALGPGAPAAPATPALTPVPTVVDGGAAPTVAEQMSQVGEPTHRPARANAAAKIPPTGIAPRTAEEAAAASGDLPPSGTPPVVQHLQERVERAHTMSTAQIIAMRAEEIGLDRAHVILAVTCGEKSSGKDLDETEGEFVLDALRRLKSGEALLVEGEEGWEVVEAPRVPNTPDDDEPVDAEIVEAAEIEGPSDGPAWRAHIKANGRTLSATMKRAVEIAHELEVPAPTDVSGLAEAEPELRRRLLTWLAGEDS